MSFSIVQQTTATASGASGTSATLTLNGVASGNLLVLACSTSTATTFITYSTPTNYTANGVNTDNVDMEGHWELIHPTMFYRASAPSGTNSVTVTMTGDTITGASFWYAEISGATPSSPLDALNYTPMAHPISTSQSLSLTSRQDALLLALVFPDNSEANVTSVSATGWTSQTSVTDSGPATSIFPMTKVLAGGSGSGSTTFSPTLSNATDGVIWLAAFAPATLINPTDTATGTDSFVSSSTTFTGTESGTGAEALASTTTFATSDSAAGGAESITFGGAATTAATSTTSQATGRVGARNLTKLPNGNYLLVYHDGTTLKSKEFATDVASAGASANTVLSSVATTDALRGTMLGWNFANPVYETISNQVPSQAYYTSGVGWNTTTNAHSLADTGLVSGFLYQSGGTNYYHRHYNDSFSDVFETIYTSTGTGYATTDNYFLVSFANVQVSGLVSLPWNGKVLAVALDNNKVLQWASKHSLTQTSTGGKTLANLTSIETVTGSNLNLAGSVDSNGNAWIAYNDGTGVKVRVLDASGSSWTGKTTITTTAGDSSFALCNTNDGLMWIVWIDSGTGNAIYACSLSYSGGTVTKNANQTWVAATATRQGLISVDQDVTQYITIAWVEGAASPWNVNVLQAQTGATATFTFADQDTLATNEHLAFGTVTPTLTDQDQLAINEQLAISNAQAQDSAMGTEGIGTRKSQYLQALANDGPLRYWRLNETSGTVANDIAGSQNGTYAGGFTLNQASPLYGVEAYGTASVLFNGSTGHVTLPVTGLPYGNVAVSLEGWMMVTGGAGTARIAIYYGTSSSNEYIYFGVNASNFIYAGTGAAGLTSSTTPTNGVWYHVVVTYDGASHSNLYINGVNAGSSSTGTAAYTSGAADIGSIGSTDWWFGNLSEMLIYNYVLSPTQVLNHYNLATGNSQILTLSDQDMLATNDSASTIVIPNPTDSATGSETVSFLGIVSVTDAATGAEIPSISTTFAVPNDLANGAETPALTLMFTMTDTGAGSQAFALGNVSMSLTDAGAGAQTPSVSVSPFSLPTDSGTGGQTVQVSLTFPLSDSATGGQTVTAVVTPPLTDSGSGSESVTHLATYSLTDTATGAELESTQVNIPLSDTGAGTDVITLATVPVSVPLNTGAGTDAATMQVNLALIPAGSGSESLTLAITGMAVPDTGTGSDTIAIARTISLADSGAGSEILSMLQSFPVVDSATGSQAGPTFSTNAFTPTWTPDRGTPTEQVQITSFSFPLSDAALGAESLSLSIQVPVLDAGTVNERFYWGQNVTLAVTDTATGAQVQTVVVGIALPDAATGTEQILTTATFAISDLAHGLETPALAINLALGDPGTGLELTPVRATLTVTDAGVGADSPNITLRGINPTADTATGSEQVVISQITKPIGPDTATGAETLAFTANITLPLSDTALGAESIAASVTLPSSDTGTGSDTAILSLARLTLTDAGTGAELLNTLLTFSKVDGGLGTDQVAQAVMMTMQDSATDKYQALSLGNIQPSALDVASGSEAIQLTMGFSVNDTATVAELVPLSTSFALLDNPHGVEALGIGINTALADTGTGGNSLLLGTATIPLSDGAAGAESLTISLIPVQVADQGAGAQALSLAPVAITFVDNASGAEVLSARVTPSQMTDTGAGGDSVSSIVLAINIVPLAESGAGTQTITYEVTAFAPTLVLRIP